MPVAPSKNQVTNAGKLLRAYFFDDSGEWIDPMDVSDALDTVQLWRKAHANPMLSANMGLRSRLATLGCRAVSRPSQRLKRLPTIIDKLGREPGMKLGGMGDIGGCRVVLNDVDDVYRLYEHYQRRSPHLIRRTKDYIESPRASGYRALHLNVEYKKYLTEIQLRTRAMHEWAVMVENMSSRTNQDIKSGRGPEVVQKWFQRVSEAMALEEAGLTVPGTLGDEIAELRERALPLLVRP